MSKRADQTREWQQYLDGQDYNNKINLYENVNKNERFYAGDQWAGVVSNGLPTPVFNIFKRIINYFIATIMSQNIAVQFVAEGVGDEPANAEEALIKEAAETLTQYSETLAEKNKMLALLRQALLDSALSGDACAYDYFEASINTGQDMQGDICIEGIDSVNVMFGNPNDKRVNANGKPVQPYIIIVFREMVANLKAEAKANKVEKSKIDLITADTDTDYQSGDRAKIELDNKGDEVGKATALLKLWKQDGKIMAKKSTRYTDIRPEWDTGLTLYPVAWMNWDPRKNSYHGQAVGTGLVPNQIFINKMFAMAMMSLMHTAFPKALYNKSVITGWDNMVGGAIGVDVDPAQNIMNAAGYMQPGNMSEQVFKLIDLAIQYTKDMLGATDAALGEVKPDNTSAIIAVQQSAAIPLETIKQNLYQFVEDIAYNLLDMMATKYGKRKIDVVVMGQRVTKEFDFASLKNMKLRIKIDVGPSSYWSQIAAMQTLDALLVADRITFLQYLDRVPNGLIPKSQELIKEIEAQDTKQQFIWKLMGDFMDTLPPEVQEQLKQMEPDAMEQQIMQMMQQQQPQQPAADPLAQQAQQDAQMQQDQSHMDKQTDFLRADQVHQQKLQLADKQHSQKMELAHVQNFGKEQLARLAQKNKPKAVSKK